MNCNLNIQEEIISLTHAKEKGNNIEIVDGIDDINQNPNNNIPSNSEIKD